MEKTFTVQGRDTSVPAIVVSGKTGSASSISNDCNNQLIRPSLLGNNSQTTSYTTQEASATLAKENVSDNSDIISRLSMFEKMCENLQKQVEDLQKENQLLKNSLKINKRRETHLKDPGIPSTPEFHTDEEELARETDWILCKSKKKNTKKRKAESSPEIEPEPVRIVKSKPKVNTNKPKLPPVILSNIKDYDPVQKLMSVQNIKYEVKLLNNNQLSIKVTSDDDYRTLTKAINEANFEWHSYENKATRPCKVIVRGLHPTCKPELIQEDLKLEGFNVLSVVNLTRKKRVEDKQTVVNLPLFMLTFDYKEDTKKIFAITHILNTKVKIEAIRKPRNQIPQCKRCQRFEHTQAFCKRDARCVKCGGSHLTADCIIDKKVAPKCCNCQEAHPANYRGCVVAKELQKRRAMKKKADVQSSNKKQQKQITLSKPTRGSYADVVRKNSVIPVRQKTQKNLTLNETPMTHFDLLFQKIEEISSRLSKIEEQYASRNIGTPRTILKK